MADLALATLDFEASSLDEHGFPIEVACVIGTVAGIHTQFSTLIRPASNWNLAKGWSDASQRIHGIPLEQLPVGMPAERVCSVLNELLRGLEVAVDGGTYDQFWLGRLFEGREQAFTLDHLSGIDPKAFRSAKQRAALEHRALPDARWLWETVTSERAQQTV